MIRPLKSLAVAVALMLCVLQTSYAAFPAAATPVSITTAATVTNRSAVSVVNAHAAHVSSVASGEHKKTFFSKAADKVGHLRAQYAALWPKYKFKAIYYSVLDLLLNCGSGVARFYMGYTTEGIMQLIFFVCGVVGYALIVASAATASLLMPGALLFGLFVFSFIWQVVDLIRICSGSLKPKGGFWDL